MLTVKRFIKIALIAVFVCLAILPAVSQEDKKEEKKEVPTLNVKRVMWEPVSIGERDLFWGPGGQQMQPVIAKSQYLGRQTGGNNLKYRVKDGAGREWVVKVADEAQPEVAAVRLLWAIGYKTEINYLVPKWGIERVGNYKNVRFEARPDNLKRLDRWSWTDNPFIGTSEFEALKIMMAMFNNWDIKDENTVIIQEGDTHHYVIADLGASFGKLAKEPNSRSGRSVNKPEDYAESNFIKRVIDDTLELDYRGKADTLIKNVKVEHGRWLADLLVQLSDKQIEDAFRAANYKPEDVELLAAAFRMRIKELDEATKPAANTAETK